ncbi:MAG: response regulator, partial [Spirochaetaceae bacterium]|nr:response regulator [Spirochaetaceae bacterium]
MAGDTMFELSEITILYVEDDPGNRRLMRAIVDTENGWQLLMAETGEAGIRLAREHLPDIVLMDINLPGMSGCEACAVLKRDRLTARI